MVWTVWSFPAVWTVWVFLAAAPVRIAGAFPAEGVLRPDRPEGMPALEPADFLAVRPEAELFPGEAFEAAGPADLAFLLLVREPEVFLFFPAAVFRTAGRTDEFLEICPSAGSGFREAGFSCGLFAGGIRGSSAGLRPAAGAAETGEGEGEAAGRDLGSFGRAAGWGV
jgi:hypothetical protein